MKTEFRTLYKNTTLGQLQSWQIIVEGNTYYTIEGINQLSQSKPTVCVGKNIGKANETTPEQQALLEARSLFKKKLDKGYSEGQPEVSKFFEPMLAFEREKYEKLLFTVPTYVQPKLDGCLDYYTIVHTDKGNLYIGDIVEKEINCDVLSYNEKTKKTEFKKVLGRYKNINSDQVKWFELETEDGVKIKITGNHRVYLPKLKCWRRVDQLSTDDYLLSN